MLNNEVINKVYSKFLVTDSVSIRELIELGLKSKDIKKLIMLKYITLDMVGNYVINDLDALYQYGLELYNEGREDEAYKVYKKCYDLGSKNDDLSFDLYFSALDNKEYNLASNYYLNLKADKCR